MRKSAIRIVCFMLILIMVLGYVNKVFKVKDSDGIYSLTKFYELEDNTVDVLILGSSHAFEHFNTGTLWDEYGMASYILAGAIQPMWNTYYYLKEALKTQKPELIVLEGYTLGWWNEEYSEDVQMIKNNLGLKWSKDKVDSIKTSVPKERWDEFFLEYEQYHTRYSDLSDSDFLKNQNNRLYDDWKGFGCNMTTTLVGAIDAGAITERTAIFEKSEKYYRATIELAQENDIPIIVVISPYAGLNENEQQIFNTASDVAAEYGVPFINCNLYMDEIKIDYVTDAADYSHLNYRGNQKFSSFIGQYMKDNYDISDRRGDEKYESWSRDADYIRQMIKNQKLVETYDLAAITEMLQDPSYWVMISVDGYTNTSDENLRPFLESQGIYNQGEWGIWIIKNNKLVWETGMEAAEQYMRTPSHDFHLKRSINAAGQYENTIIVDNEQYQKASSGLNVLVYDTKTEKLVDMFGIDMNNDYRIIK